MKYFTSLKSAKVKLCLSMAIFGTLGIFTRNISVGSGELALYRAILASVFIVGYLLLTKQSLPIKKIKHELPLLFLSGSAIGVNWILLFQAYRYTTISTATLSYYFAPVIVTVVCPFLFHEKLTRKQVLCFVMSTIGLIMIIGVNDIGMNSSHLIGILFGLGAACFYALVILLNKFIKDVSGLHRTLLQFLAVIVVLLPYVICTGGSTLTALDGVGWLCLLIVGLIHTGITYCMYFSSLKDLPGQEAAILSYIDPLVAVLVSVLVLNESITLLQIVGGAMILIFSFLNEREN